MRRLLLLASGLLTLALFPATSAAATHNGGIIYTDTVHVRAYKMTLLALTSGKGHGDLVAISFVRGTSNDEQEHYYQFTKHVQVRLAPHGESGTIKANLGQFGRIDMSFSAGGGRVTPGCPGAYLFQHNGTLTGTFHFISGSSYFKTVNESSIRAASATTKKGISCKPATPTQAHGTELDVDSFSAAAPTLGGSDYDFNIERGTTGHIIEQFLVLDTSMVSEGIVISHAIDVSRLPSSAFTNASDLSSATAQAISQWMSGTVNFTGAIVTGDTAQGTVSGSITAHFDGMPTVTVPAGTTEATLSVS